MFGVPSGAWGRMQGKYYNLFSIYIIFGVQSGALASIQG